MDVIDQVLLEEFIHILANSEEYIDCAIGEVQDCYFAELPYYDRQNEIEFYGESTYQYMYLGSVFSLMPSGKYWHVITPSNVNTEEILQDCAYRIALEQAADKYGCWIENSEYDPCDIMLVKELES